MKTSRKKIALVGNVNNISFVLARFLRDKGYPCDVLHPRKNSLLFHPSADTFNIKDLELIKEIDWGFRPAELLHVSRKSIREDLKGYGLIFAEGHAPLFLEYAGINIDIYHPVGNDLRSAPFKPAWRSLILNKDPAIMLRSLSMPKLQKKAILKSRSVICSDLEGLSLLGRLGYRGERLMLRLPLIYHEAYTGIEGRVDIHWAGEISNLRNNHDFICIHQARHDWARKGTEKIINAFKLFKDKGACKKPLMIFFSNGGDVLKSRALIGDSGLEENVVWFPGMFRKEIMFVLKMSDVCVGEFNLGNWSGAATLEGIVAGRPVIQNISNDESSHFGTDPIPIWHAATEHEIASVMEILATDVEKREQRSKEALKWYEKWFLDKWFNRFLATIDEIVNSK